MTISQAADFLNVSRPYLITLLETGELRYTNAGAHRRIRLKDLVDYKDKIRQQGSDAMDELVKIAQETNLGRHLVSAGHYRKLRIDAFGQWTIAVA